MSDLKAGDVVVVVRSGNEPDNEHYAEVMGRVGVVTDYECRTAFCHKPGWSYHSIDFHRDGVREYGWCIVRQNLRKLPPDQHERADAAFDWRNVKAPREPELA